MAYAPQHTDLVTPERVRAALLRSDTADILAEEALSSSGEYPDEGLAAISAASEEVEDYLHRELIAREQTFRFADRDWQASQRAPTDYDFRAYLRQWPIVQTDADVNTDGRKVWAASELDSLTAIVGFRREDHELADFPQAVQDAVDSIDDIPLLPDLVPAVTAEVAIIHLKQRLEGVLGVSDVEQRAGDFQSTLRMRSEDRGAAHRRMTRLQGLRYIG